MKREYGFNVNLKLTPFQNVIRIVFLQKIVSNEGIIESKIIHNLSDVQIPRNISQLLNHGLTFVPNHNYSVKNEIKKSMLDFSNQARWK